ncbi:branched-chain amino acid ABC transporter permease [Pseudogracilibacillus sp. SO30301A]|uniref:branched-chain amino acid ABC transporter permease n=1 Tax=Pseudogracilibacillus sp. SO30301A TaxID=3098291 RepID=UPI00300E22F4
MGDLIQFIMTGLTIGSIYEIVALGFVTIYSVTKIINLAQGEFVMLGGMLMITFVGMGIPFVIAFILTLIMVTIIGWVLEFAVFRRVKDADPISLIILTIGIAILIRGLASIGWGKGSFRLESFTAHAPLKIFNATINIQSIWVMCIMLAVVIFLYIMMEKTILGKAFRGTSDNPVAARLMGISSVKMATLAFMLSGGLGALAGVAIAPIMFPSYDLGIMLGIKGFSAAIFGGLGSAPGAVIGGLVIGLVESLGGGYISSGLKDAITFSFVLLLLLIRPSGILGEKSVGKGGL